jgi:hypothetical protein
VTQEELIEQLRHACSVALGDLLALGMPEGASTGKLLLTALNVDAAHAYTQDMRRRDYDTLVALVEKQRALHLQLGVISQDLLTFIGKASDHASGFQHKPETCTTCAAQISSTRHGDAAS